MSKNPLTFPERRALEAVRDGVIVRVYTKRGNHFRVSDRARANVLWRLTRDRLIADGPCTGVIERHSTQLLTKRGVDALASGEYPVTS